MTSRCTIVMYHYVRELRETRFPEIRGLTVTEFRGQLAYMMRFYDFITVDRLIEALRGGAALPPNASLLTFDDGYSDHYASVFPILDAAGIQGVFFPPVSAVRDGRVLDVNKIHFVLAAGPGPNQLRNEVFDILDRLRAEGHDIAPNDALYDELAVEGTFDPPEIIFLKRLLQRALPEMLRAEITDVLFRRHVTENELAFARDLYVTGDQLSLMARHGMAIGSHGTEHRWLDTLDAREQRAEVEGSVDFLTGIGVPTHDWIMCYPYGAHDTSLRAICAELGCAAGVTTTFDIAVPGQDDPLALPRLDTNHLPKTADAGPNDWTRRVLEDPT